MQQDSELQLATYQDQEQTVIAFMVNDRLYDCHQVHPGLPLSAEHYLSDQQRYEPLAKLMYVALANGAIRVAHPYRLVKKVEGFQPLVSETV